MSEKRIEIMDAAERRIRNAGYNGFSFRDIASDVGVKKERGPGVPQPPERMDVIVCLVSYSPRGSSSGAD